MVISCGYSDLAMDNLDKLAVRFHFSGDFFDDGKRLHYCGGREGMSYIDRDKLSLPEVQGHLKDHCEDVELVLMHWQFPGKALKTGLRALTNDEDCQTMADCITDGGVVDIFVEAVGVDDDVGSDGDGVGDKGDEHSDWEDESEAWMHTDDDEALDASKEVEVIEVSPADIAKDIACKRKFYNTLPDMKGKAKADYKTCSDYRKRYKAGHLVAIDESRGQGGDDDSDTSYFSESEEEDSYEEGGSDGELLRRKPKYPRYDPKASLPTFSLGMGFSCKGDFIQAVRQYGVERRHVINFCKNDNKRVRAQCEWAKCPWFILLSNNSRTEGWLVTSFKDEHTCPPRRDNKLVTSRRIAEKFESAIMGNPTWKLEHLKQTVQEQMHADVSIAKCKRAKSIVMQKVLDSKKGEYGRVFDYQMELLRSNPGSTVVVKLHPDTPEAVFHRMYICLDACKRGFLAGCRKVIGLDGCFFKGPTNGELICAMGRDANNQMYPIAWAVVEKETNESWDWFCGIFFKDIEIGDGEGWVIISDQQKVSHISVYSSNLSYPVLNFCLFVAGPTKCCSVLGTQG